MNMNMTNEEMEINTINDMIESGDIEGFLNHIDQMAASKAYLVIRDNITSKHIRAIKESCKDNYQKFQDIKARAKESWDYDHRQATMLDVNRGCMNVYTLILNIMKAQNAIIDEEFNKIHLTINKIEEKVGLDITNWNEESSQKIDTNGGNENVNDVQRVEENI